MPIIEEDFLLFAKEVLSNPLDAEFNCRNAISRAYYAIYHAASKKTHCANGKPFSSLCSHEQLIQKYVGHHGSTTRDREIREIGLAFRKLRNDRIISEYALNQTISRINAECIILETVSSLKRLARL